MSLTILASSNTIPHSLRLSVVVAGHQSELIVCERQQAFFEECCGCGRVGKQTEMVEEQMNYRQISNISHTKSQNLTVSRLVL